MSRPLSATPEELAERYGGKRPDGYPIERQFPKPPNNGVKNVPVPHAIQQDEVALSFWEFFMRTVHPDHFAQQDMGNLALLCETHSAYEKLRNEWDAYLKSGGTMLHEGRGHPLIKIMRDVRKEIFDISKKLCLIPAERNRLVPVDAYKKKNQQPANAEEAAAEALFDS